MHRACAEDHQARYRSGRSRTGWFVSASSTNIQKATQSTAKKRYITVESASIAVASGGASTVSTTATRTHARIVVLDQL